MNPYQNRPELRAAREEIVHAALDGLYRRHTEDLRRQMRTLSRSFGLPATPDQVEERVQEVYCRLLTGGSRKLYQLGRWHEGRIANYLGRIAQRIVVDEVRARSAIKRGGGGRVALAGRMLNLANRAVDPHGTPEKQAMLKQARRLLLERCRSFVSSQSQMRDEERQRNFRVLRRSLLEGWSSEEIARAEGGRLAASTVDTLVYRLRRRLLRSGVELPSR